MSSAAWQTKQWCELLRLLLGRCRTQPLAAGGVEHLRLKRFCNLRSNNRIATLVHVRTGIDVKFLRMRKGGEGFMYIDHRKSKRIRDREYSGPSLQLRTAFRSDMTA